MGRKANIDYRVSGKREAQLKNVEIWRHLTGRQSFRPSEQYWTLVDSNSFEWVTLKEVGLLPDMSQFHGVNDDLDKCLACQQAAPEIQVHHGDWVAVVARDQFCPAGGIVYLDTMHQPDTQRSRASTLLAVTLEACPEETLVCANFCWDNPRQGREACPTDVFAERVVARLRDKASQWAILSDGEFNVWLPQRTDTTQMGTIFFWRPRTLESK